MPMTLIFMFICFLKNIFQFFFSDTDTFKIKVWKTRVCGWKGGLRYLLWSFIYYSYRCTWFSFSTFGSLLDMLTSVRFPFHKQVLKCWGKIIIIFWNDVNTTWVFGQKWQAAKISHRLWILNPITLLWHADPSSRRHYTDN